MVSATQPEKGHQEPAYTIPSEDWIEEEKKEVSLDIKKADSSFAQPHVKSSLEKLQW